MSKTKTALTVSVAAWAVLVTAVLASAMRPVADEGNLPAPQENAPERPVTVITECFEEEEPELDMSHLPQIENATLTHYCICEQCCGKDESHPAYGITASGRAAEPYVSVAVDPFIIELGSTVYVDYGDGEIHEYRADDTGSNVNGARIDLCVSSHEEALELGIRTVRVWYE